MIYYEYNCVLKRKRGGDLKQSDILRSFCTKSQLKKEDTAMAENYKDAFVTSCPFCGGTEMTEGFQGGYAELCSSANKLSGSQIIYHSVCRNCGSVVRSYVKDPEKMLKKKDRKVE